MGSVGEGRALVDLVQKLLLHLRDGVTVQNLGGQGLAFSEACTLHQHVQGLQDRRREVSPEESSTAALTAKESFCHQSSVLHIFSQQPVVIQGVLGLAGHSIHGAFVHLVLDGPEEHVETLARRVLQRPHQL